MRINILSLLFLLVHPPLVQGAAGGITTGNGGNTVVCRDKTNKVIWMKSLDLVEAEQTGFHITAGREPYQEQVKQALVRLESVDSDYAQLLRLEIEKTKDNMRFVENDADLLVIADSKQRLKPINCPGKIFVEQIANYLDGHPLLIVKRRWNHLNETHRAAIILHEGVYKLERVLFNAQDSIYARKIVGMLLSDSLPSSLDLWHSKYFARGNHDDILSKEKIDSADLEKVFMQLPTTKPQDLNGLRWTYRHGNPSGIQSLVFADASVAVNGAERKYSAQRFERAAYFKPESEESYKCRAYDSGKTTLVCQRSNGNDLSYLIYARTEQPNQTRSAYSWFKETTVSVVSPQGSTKYAVGNTVPIEWRCASSMELHATPISLDYTSDDGETFTTIADNLKNNLTASTGSYVWTLPTALDGTVFRIRVSCKSAAGIAQNVYSPFMNTKGWNIFMGDSRYALKDVPAPIADVSGNTRSSIAANADEDLFYVKGQAIMKIESKTGYVTEFTKAIAEPEILGTTLAKDSLLVLSKKVSRILKVDTRTSKITEWANLTGFDPKFWFLTFNKILVFFEAAPSNKIYKIDLHRSKQKPVHVQGDGTCAIPPFSINADARKTPIPVQTADQCPGEINIIANADASRIWLTAYWTYSGYRLDLSGDHYVIGKSNTGQDQRNLRNCVASDFDNRIYCVSRGNGRFIKPFDVENETWLSSSEVPFEKNDNTGFLSLGLYAKKLVAHYSLNSIQLVTPNIGSTWNYEWIAGQPISNLDALINPRGIEYNRATNTLWVFSTAGHVRKLQLDKSPNTASVFHNDLFWNGRAGVNTAGTAMAVLTSCARQYITTFSLSDFSSRMNFLYGPCNRDVGTYPPANGTNALNGASLFNDRIPRDQKPLYHSNGKVYFGTVADKEHEAFVFESNGNVINRVAPVGAHFTKVHQFQESASGDILIWDSTQLRKLTVTTEAAAPKVYTLIDYSKIPGYAGNGCWSDVYYEEGTKTTYYVSCDGAVRKAISGPQAFDSAYDFSGITLSGAVRIAKVPAVGLLVLQPDRSRILKIAP